jgi:hypothetical protein
VIGWVYFSKSSEELLDKKAFYRVSQPCYSPDVTYSDFWLFGHMKATRQGHNFEEREELLYPCDFHLVILSRMSIFSEFHVADAFWLGRTSRRFVTRLNR